MADEMDPGREKELSRGKKALYTVAGIGLLLVFLELLGVILYFVAIPRQSREVIELTLGVRAQEGIGTSALHYKPHPYFNYVLNPEFRYPDGRRPYNAYGFRMPEWPGRKAKGTLRIVALGGSTTFGMFAERGEDVWPAMAEKALSERFPFTVEVYNLGVPGYTTNEILGVLSMLAPVLEPDIVLIHCGANDAFAQVYPDEGGPDNTRFRFSWNYRPLPAPIRFALRYSHLLRTAAVLLLSQRSYLPGDVFRLFQYPHPAKAQALENGNKAVGKYFRRNLKSMVALVRDLAAIPVLIDHPLNPKWDAPRSPVYRSIMEAHLRCNRICLEVGGDLRVPVIDLFPWMRDARLFRDAIHESALGMKLKADIVAKHLEALIADLRRQAPLPGAG